MLLLISLDEVPAKTFSDRWKNERCSSGRLHTICSRYWDSQCAYYKTFHPRKHKTKFWEHGTGAHQGIKWRTLHFVFVLSLAELCIFFLSYLWPNWRFWCIGNKRTSRSVFALLCQSTCIKGLVYEWTFLSTYHHNSNYWIPDNQCISQCAIVAQGLD